MSQVEVRFKASTELSNKIKELQTLGEFDSAGGAAKSALAATIDSVIAAYKLLGSGQAIAQPQPPAPEAVKTQTPAQQNPVPTPTTAPPPGGFGNSFAGTKNKLAS